MFSKVVLIAALCVTSTLGAGRQLAIGRNQPIPGGPITLDHKPYDSHFKASQLAVTCGAGGLLTLKLSTLNDFAISTIVIGAEGGFSGCKSTEFTFPEDADKASLATTKDETCGRTVVEQDGVQKYKWDVKVTETFQTKPNVHRAFPAAVSVFCHQKIDAIAPIDAQPEDLTPVVEGPADYDQPIEFVIEKTEGLVENHWEFSLKPRVEEAIGALNYKIKSCTAKPKHDDATDEHKVEIIKNSCIDEIGVDVDVEESPKKQKITVYPFQFKDFEDADITLTCLVDLCKEEECAKIEVCPAEPAPIPGTRGRSSIIRRAQRPKRSVDTVRTVVTF